MNSPARRKPPEPETLPATSGDGFGLPDGYRVRDQRQPGRVAGDRRGRPAGDDRPCLSALDPRSP